MSRYTLAEPARIDLASIRHYLSPAPKPIQARILLGLKAGFQQAAELPQTGQIEPTYGNPEIGTVRSLLVSPYRIFYRAEARPVIVIAILHGARDIPAVLRGRAPTLS